MNIKDVLHTAQQAQKSGDVDLAEQSYLSLYKQGFQIEGVLNELVTLCLNDQRMDRAIVYSAELVTLFPEQIYYCENLANIYAKLRLWDQAGACFQNFITKNGPTANARFNLAYYLKLSGNFEGALTHYQAAIDSGITQPEEVLTNMAVICSENMRLETRAKELLESALSYDSSYTPALYNLASLHEEEGNNHLATELFKRILVLEPSNYQALARLADVVKVTGYDDPLISQIKQALDQQDIDQSTKVNLYFALGKALDDCREFDQAFNYYQLGNEPERGNKPQYHRDQQESVTLENINLFTEQWFRGISNISDEEPIFICGMFRSGSTLTEQILAAHPKITAGGERDFFFRLVSRDLTPYPSKLRGVDVSELKLIADQYQRDLAEAFPGANYITDKRPDNFQYIGLIKSAFPNAKIIHTLRNPLDNCLSIYFLRLASAMTYAKNLSDIAHYYNEHLRVMSHWNSLFSDTIHQVSYEALVSDPELTIKSILGFLGLDWDAQCLDFHLVKNRVKTASSAQVRRPLYQSSNGRWKNYQKHLLPLIEQFGFEQALETV